MDEITRVFAQPLFLSGDSKRDTVANLQPMTEKLVESINKEAAFNARKYYAAFNKDMSTAERIGCLTRMVEAGIATDAEEGELLDLINPFTPY